MSSLFKIFIFSLFEFNSFSLFFSSDFVTFGSTAKISRSFFPFSMAGDVLPLLATCENVVGDRAVLCATMLMELGNEIGGKKDLSGKYPFVMTTLCVDLAKSLERKGVGYLPRSFLFNAGIS